MSTFVTYDGDEKLEASETLEGDENESAEHDAPRRARPLFALYDDPSGAQEQWTAAQQSSEQWGDTVRGLLNLILGLRMQRDGLELQRSAQALIGRAFAHEYATDFEKEISALDLRLAIVRDQLDAARQHHESAQRIEREAQAELGQCVDEALGWPPPEPETLEPRAFEPQALEPQTPEPEDTEQEAGDDVCPDI